MESENTFKTKTGFCHVLPDKIVLTRDGTIGNIADVTVGDNIKRPLIIYGIFAIALIYFGFNNYKKGDVLSAFFFGVLGAYLIYGILSSLNNSATPVIDRRFIKTVKFKKGILGLTRSRFEVLFKNERGKIKKRLIMLPSSLTGGENTTEKAVEVMTKEKLI